LECRTFASVSSSQEGDQPLGDFALRQQGLPCFVVEQSLDDLTPNVEIRLAAEPTAETVHLSMFDQIGDCRAAVQNARQHLRPVAAEFLAIRPVEQLVQAAACDQA
jgi:hypothetical protein